MDAEMGLLGCTCICPDLYYIPKLFWFSWLAFLQNEKQKTNKQKEQIIAALAFGSCTERTNVNRKHCWNEGGESAAVQFISQKRGCVGKPLWWAPTRSARKPVVNNRCSIVHVAALCSFRESDTLRPQGLMHMVSNRFSPLRPCACIACLCLYLFGLKLGLRWICIRQF